MAKKIELTDNVRRAIARTFNEIAPDLDGASVTGATELVLDAGRLEFHNKEPERQPDIAAFRKLDWKVQMRLAKPIVRSMY